MMKLYKEKGGIVDFTQEELLFSPFHHDLGKLGEKGNIIYKLQESGEIKTEVRFILGMMILVI